MTWTTTASPSDLWRVQGTSQRRITEEVALRRTEQGEVRIVYRGGGNPWSPATATPPGGWVIVSADVRLTEAGDPRIVE